jgi:hypothetical protein
MKALWSEIEVPPHLDSRYRGRRLPVIEFCASQLAPPATYALRRVSYDQAISLIHDDQRWLFRTPCIQGCQSDGDAAGHENELTP